jgi:hypothetical protein
VKLIALVAGVGDVEVDRDRAYLRAGWYGGEIPPEQRIDVLAAPCRVIAGGVRGVVEAGELLEAATRDARFKVERTKLEAEKVERVLWNMSRERLLPDDKTLEEVGRYEVHLSRQMFKALHELEALQARRTGGAAPLARLDVDGLAEG